MISLRFEMSAGRHAQPGEYCPAMHFGMDMWTMFTDDVAVMLALCEKYDLAATINGPLGKGLLTGKFDQAAQLPATDLRHQRGWNLREGSLAKQRQALERLRDILTSDGLTLAQAALGALCARSERIIPIPGFKTLGQVEENG